jgi:hypothetical protein
MLNISHVANGCRVYSNPTAKAMEAATGDGIESVDARRTILAILRPSTAGRTS